MFNTKLNLSLLKAVVGTTTTKGSTTTTSATTSTKTSGGSSSGSSSSTTTLVSVNKFWGSEKHVKGSWAILGLCSDSDFTELFLLLSNL